MSEMHYFNVEVAAKYGVNCAVLLQNIWHWVQKNEANGQNCFDGKYWTYNSVRAFAQLFPYLSDKQIRSALKRLEDEGLIETGDFNKNRYDRTLWYSVTAKGRRVICGIELPEASDKTEKMTCLFVETDLTKRQNQNSEKGGPIPDINTDINTDINHIENETRAREDGFDEFWTQYPRKEGKAKAETAWKRLKPDEVTRAEIMAALARSKTTPQWSEDGGRFIPHAATWLNGRRWEDEPTVACTPMSNLERLMTEVERDHDPFNF